MERYCYDRRYAVPSDVAHDIGKRSTEIVAEIRYETTILL
jgi:hypothetical protein